MNFLPTLCGALCCLFFFACNQPVLENCSAPGDEDGDGFVNCDDPDCLLSVCDGAPCQEDSDCLSGFCNDEISTGFPEGYCSSAVRACDPIAQDCVGGGACIAQNNSVSQGVCFAECELETGLGCRGAYQCLDPNGDGFFGVCLPSCLSDSQCPSSDFCDSKDGLCKSLEICGDGIDNDRDFFFDCEDESDCGQTSECQNAISAACAAPEEALFVTFDNTFSGTRLFRGGCTGLGGPEDIFSITPGTAGQIGTLSLILASDSDQGMYVRTNCEDFTSEIACVDGRFGGDNERLQVPVLGGNPLTIFVDGFRDDQTAGPYTLFAEFTEDVCGDSEITGFETCDDGNTLPSDGCDENCQIDFDFLCEENGQEVLLGDTLGNTSLGTDLVDSFCTGGGKEEVFRFTPLKSGTIRILLTPEVGADLGFYTKSACESIAKFHCVDQGGGGEPEEETLTVIGGVELFIFVDTFVDGLEGNYTLTLEEIL